MSSVVNKSKNKFAPKAKVRIRAVASNTSSAAESTPSVSSTPAPAPTPTPTPAPVSKPLQVTVDVLLPAPPAPEASEFPPTPISQPSPYDYDGVSTPSEPRNLGIPMLEGETIVVRQSVPPQPVDETEAPVRQSTENDRGVLVNGGIPQLKDDGIDWTGATQVGQAVEKAKTTTKENPKPKETQKETEDVAIDLSDSMEETEGEATETVAKKLCTRKAPTVSRKRKVAASPATPVIDAGASPEGSRRPIRAKAHNPQAQDAELDDDEDEDDPMDDIMARAFEPEDESEGDEYVAEEGNERQPKKNKPAAKKTKAKAKAKEPKEKAPRKPRAPRKPKEPGERRTRRAKTPEDAEERTIEEGVVKMKDLCSDLKMGRKSKRLKELEATDWTEVARKQVALRTQIAEQSARGEIVAETDEQRLERLAQANQARQSSRPVAAPQMRVVDGQLVLDEESLHVNRHQRDALEIDEMEIVEENVHTRIVNSSTWSKREKGDRWEEDSTERFYEALSMFGTDFEMISKLFPGRSRRMIKNKFNCEERKNPGRITLAFKTRVTVNMDEYAELAGQKFPDPHQLEEELQRLRDDHEAEADAQKEQAVAMERERQDMANKAMRDAEGGIGVVQEQTGRKRKKKSYDASKQGEVVLGLSLEEYERERLLYADGD